MLTKRGYDLKTVKQDQELALQAYLQNLHTYLHTYVLNIHTYIHTYIYQTAQASGNRSREIEAALANNATLTQQVAYVCILCMYMYVCE